LNGALDLFFELGKTNFQSELLYYTKQFDTKYSLTLDVWTASNQQDYMGITVHWINKKWEMESKLLDMIALHENHTGAYLFRVLQETVTDFGIENSIFRSVFHFFFKFSFLIKN
jgi:hypothetical protein